MSLLDTIKSLCCKFCKKPESSTEDKAKEKPKAKAQKETSVKKEAKSTTTEIKTPKL